jgi:beta-N-acetylhexosaminidase
VLPATASPAVIGAVIRGAIGFGGLLMSDDLCMGALSGSMAERTRAALAAGCDMALHCNGNIEEMREVAAGAPELGGAAAQRAERALASRRPPADIDVAAARAQFSTMMAPEPAS